MKYYLRKRKPVKECEGGDIGGSAVPVSSDLGIGMGPAVPGGPDRWDNILGVGYMPPFNMSKKKRYATKKKHKK